MFYNQNGKPSQIPPGAPQSSNGAPQTAPGQFGPPMSYGAPMAGRPPMGGPPMGGPPMGGGAAFGGPPTGAPPGYNAPPGTGTHAFMGAQPHMNAAAPPTYSMGGYSNPNPPPTNAMAGAGGGFGMPPPPSMGGAFAGGPPPTGGGGGGGGYGAPPPAYGPPTGVGGFPGQGQGQGYPPASASASAPPSAPAPAPKPHAQFYSTAGGTPQPVAAQVGPPSSVGGVGGVGMGMAPPPSGPGGPPLPPAGGMGMGMGMGMPPPSAAYGQPYGAPNAFGGYDPQSPFTSPGGGGGAASANNMGGASADPAAAAAAAAASALPPLPTLEEMDLSLQCDKRFMQSSVGQLASLPAAGRASALPLGVVVVPMAGDVGVGNDAVDVVDFGQEPIIRCRTCRTYINPFAPFVDGGRRWKCNMCGVLNEVPSSYFSQLDEKGRRRDVAKRPELRSCTVEYRASSEYQAREPQPPVYFFCIDVSAIAHQSGMLATACKAISEALEALRAFPRTKVGFVTFDSAVHFYKLNAGLKVPQMVVSGDINEILLPHVTDDLLVTLADSRDVINALLEALPNMFAASQVTAVCTGPALQACKRVMKHLGGKLLLLQSSLPSLGEGSLKQRENPRQMGTDKEHLLLAAENEWYKAFAVDSSQFQICIDVFLFAAQYTDVGTFSQLSKYTAGSVYYYPNYNNAMYAQKFHQELAHTLTRATAFEAVMRVRATRGLRITNFYGNYNMMQDMLRLPNCTSDSAYAFDFDYDDQHHPVLTASAITVQVALLYTNSAGERRIRVHNLAIPVTPSQANMVKSVDIEVATTILSKQAVDLAQKHGLGVARSKIFDRTIEIIRAAKMSSSSSSSGGGFPQYGIPQQPAPAAPSAAVELPASLAFLPLYALSLIKNVVLRGGSDIRIDERAYFQQLLDNMTVEQTMHFIHPRMFAVHDLDDMAGRACDNPEETVKVAGPLNIRLPAGCMLSSENQTQESIVLLENGSDLFMWIGSRANPLILQSLFGVPSLASLTVAELSNLQLQPDSDEFSSRFYAIVSALRAERPDRFMMLHKIREGDGFAEAHFGRYMVVDRASWQGGTHTYSEFHSLVNR